MKCVEEIKVKLDIQQQINKTDEEGSKSKEPSTVDRLRERLNFRKKNKGSNFFAQTEGTATRYEAFRDREIKTVNRDHALKIDYIEDLPDQEIHTRDLVKNTLDQGEVDVSQRNLEFNDSSEEEKEENFRGLEDYPKAPLAEKKSKNRRKSKRKRSVIYDKKILYYFKSEGNKMFNFLNQNK